MGIFDTLGEEKRVQDEAKEAKRLEREREEAANKRQIAENKRLLEEEVKNYQQARRYYDESQCENIVTAIEEHLKSISGSASVVRSPDPEYVQSLPFSEKNRIYDPLVDLVLRWPLNRRNVNVFIVWGKDHRDYDVVEEYREDSYNVSYSSYTRCRIHIEMSSDGSLTIAGGNVWTYSLNQWRKDKSLIDKAFDDVYRYPRMDFPEREISRTVNPSHTYNTDWSG